MKHKKHMSKYALFPTWKGPGWLKTMGLHETLKIIYIEINGPKSFKR